MKMCIGLDVHMSSCSLAVKNEKGKLTRQMTVETTEQELIAAVKSVPAPRYLCLEEGSLSQWVYDVLRRDVEHVYVVMPEKKRGSKTDMQDAIELAEMVRVGRFPCLVVKPGGQFRVLRELVRVYVKQSVDQARVKNRIQSIYRQSCVSTKGKRPYSQRGRVELMALMPYSTQLALESLYLQLDGLLPIVANIRREMLRESHRHAISRVLETCPGLGPVRVAEAMAIVHNPNRFHSKQKFWSYSGFGIVVAASGEYAWLNGEMVRTRAPLTRGLNRKSNHRLKNIFKGAAMTAIAMDGPMRVAYMRMIQNGTKPHLARLTIARKIAASFLAMWKANEVFDPKKVA